MRTMTKRLGVTVPFLFTLAGCMSLGRDSPPLEQYVLGRAPLPEAAAASPDGAGLTIGVRRIDLAPYLAVPAIVVRRGTHQIVTSDFHRWGEDPGEGINRAVARYLDADPRVRAAAVAPWPARAEHDYLVQLHVTRFEGVAPAALTAVTGEVHVHASWEIIRPLDGALLARGVTDFRQPGWTVGDYAGLVTLLDRGLTVLAGELVARLAVLGAP
jgi:uncharacterized lipoprotein YmbA